MSTPQFTPVRREFDRVWLHESKAAWIVFYPAVPGIRQGFYQAYRSGKSSDQPWSTTNKRIGTQDGFGSFEAAAAAVGA